MRPGLGPAGAPHVELPSVEGRRAWAGAREGRLTLYSCAVGELSQQLPGVPKEPRKTDELAQGESSSYPH